MKTKKIRTTPFSDQKPGTSGLRKKVSVFRSTHYLENFIQSIFDSLPVENRNSLLIGGDGRYYNDTAIQVIIKMAMANGFKKILVGKHGYLSTPAASHLIRKYRLDGGVILSASHNPGGPDGDFGVKFNTSNGGPAPESFTNKVYELSKQIDHYSIIDCADIDINTEIEILLDGCQVQVVNSIDEYAELMQHLFDFDIIKGMFNANVFSMVFDAMHAITGPYAHEILIKRLGADENSLMNARPLPDFGGGHPDPNLAHAQQLVSLLNASVNAPDFGAASDGDGDRNMILGRHCFVTPSDSLAIMAANAHLLPGYQSGLSGVARSMPTSMAVDRVADRIGIECYETPTGWKYFGNLLDAQLITLCGEESFGTGSDHIREKDGLWAVLFWLNLIAIKKQSVADILQHHWQLYGRNYYTRHDYENVDSDKAQTIYDSLLNRLDTLTGKCIGSSTIHTADNYSYHDPVDQTQTVNQGIRLLLENDRRIIFRLSGTGTEGATIRVYYETYRPPDTGKLNNDTQNELSDLIAIAQELSELHKITGRKQPDVIT